MNDTIKALLSELKSGLAQIYGERLRGLYLFSSHARGQQQPDSDLDVLIILGRLDSYGAEIDRTGPPGFGHLPQLPPQRQPRLLLPDRLGPLGQPYPRQPPRGGHRRVKHGTRKLLDKASRAIHAA